MDNTNKIIKPWYDSIVGHCINSSNAPKCECYNDYFIGETCRINNELFNKSVVTVNNFRHL